METQIYYTIFVMPYSNTGTYTGTHQGYQRIPALPITQTKKYTQQTVERWDSVLSSSWRPAHESVYNRFIGTKKQFAQLHRAALIVRTQLLAAKMHTIHNLKVRRLRRDCLAVKPLHRG